MKMHRNKSLFSDRMIPLWTVKLVSHRVWWSQDYLEINERIIAEREEDLMGLEQSIAEVNEIFRDLGTLVNEQQYLLGTWFFETEFLKQPLDNIESNVNNVTVNMEGAAGELRQASNYQDSTGRKYMWIFLILLVVFLIVLLSLQPWRWGRWWPELCISMQLFVKIN